MILAHKILIAIVIVATINIIKQSWLESNYGWLILFTIAAIALFILLVEVCLYDALQFTDYYYPELESHY